MVQRLVRGLRLEIFLQCGDLRLDLRLLVIILAGRAHRDRSEASAVVTPVFLPRVQPEIEPEPGPVLLLLFPEVVERLPGGRAQDAFRAFGVMVDQDQGVKHRLGPQRFRLPYPSNRARKDLSWWSNRSTICSQFSTRFFMLSISRFSITPAAVSPSGPAQCRPSQSEWQGSVTGGASRPLSSGRPGPVEPPVGAFVQIIRRRLRTPGGLYSASSRLARPPGQGREQDKPQKA